MISLNDLHIQSNPKLLFMANDVKNKGRSHKSYTIKIVNDAHNDYLLDQLFSSKSKRAVSFECTYTIGSIQLNGILRVSSFDRVSADGIFISGNGKLWDTLDNAYLADYDWSASDHELNLENVLAKSGDYVYDLCDRGAFINEYETEDIPASVDISERYPAIKLKTIIETVLNQEGYGVEWSEAVYNSDLDTIYLLYTQDNAIRNSKEWEKSAIFDANGTASFTDEGLQAETSFSIAGKFEFPNEETDNGGNFTGAQDQLTASNRYTIPETGTYRFRSKLYVQLVKASTATVTNQILQVWIAVNNIGVYVVTLTNADLVFNQNVVLLEFDLDTLPIELTEDDWVTANYWYRGNINEAIRPNWIIYLNQQSGSRFYNTVSRYYGAGSTVDLSVLLPDMKALDFIGKVSKYLNLYSFYREERKILEMQHGRQEVATVKNITPVLVTEDVTELANYDLQFDTDKAEPPDDIYFDNGGFVEDVIKFDFSRTLISDCYRLFGDDTAIIPVLWEDGNPLTWDEVTEPPKWKTKGNLRLLKYTGKSTSESASTTTVTADSTLKTADASSGGCTLTYGGDNTTNSITLSAIPNFEELDISAFHKYDLELEDSQIELSCRIELDKMYDQTYFKNPLWIVGYGRYWLESAEQIKGDLYKLKLIK